jgi:hypothetical protein
VRGDLIGGWILRRRIDAIGDGQPGRVALPIIQRIDAGLAEKATEMIGVDDPEAANIRSTVIMKNILDQRHDPFAGHRRLHLDDCH